MIEKESDMYLPVKDMLVNMGYTVNGEVKSCDIAAVKDGELLICEMKKSFNLKLVYQLMDRKNMTAAVYAVIPSPKSFTSKSTESMLQLLKKLGIGLITVSGNTMFAQIVLEPADESGAPTKKRQRNKNKIINEVSSRVTAEVGGTTRKRVMTLYKESSVAALCYIEENGCLKTRLIKKEIANAVKSNYYEWFEKIGRGEYKITEKGKAALGNDEYKKVVDYYRKEVNEKCLK